MLHSSSSTGRLLHLFGQAGHTALAHDQSVHSCAGNTSGGSGLKCPPPAAAGVLAVVSMRALYGTDGTRNSCHGSDCPASAAREIKFFFPDLKLDTAAATGGAKVRSCICQQMSR
jgi:hypothetical protein